MYPPSWRTFMSVVLMQRSTWLYCGSILVLIGITLGLGEFSYLEGLVVAIFTFASGLLSREVLIDLKREGNRVTLDTLKIGFPFRLERKERYIPLSQVYKVEYLARDENAMGQIHLIVKNSREPSREYTVKPDDSWAERARSVNQALVS